METLFNFFNPLWCLVLWSYLQGMETVFELSEYLEAEQLWSYLQGMETSALLLRVSGTGSSFDPTYKGWKLSLI